MHKHIHKCMDKHTDRQTDTQCANTHTHVQIMIMQAESHKHEITMLPEQVGRSPKACLQHMHAVEIYEYQCNKEQHNEKLAF